jgi:predicted ATPase
MSAQRLTELRIEGMRCVDRIRLPLDGLTVLIGENGSGKSTIIEACELLARAAQPNFLDAFNRIHGGASSLLRAHTDRLVLGVRIDDDGTQLEYELSIAKHGVYTVIDKEEMWIGPSEGGPRRPVLTRTADEGSYFDPATASERRLLINPQHTALSGLEASTPDYPALHALRRTVGAFEVHVPFDTLPYWVSQDRKRTSEMREPVTLAPASRLERYGSNIANAFHSLKNDFPGKHWQDTLAYVRLGLGEDVEDVGTRADASGGRHALTVKYRDVTIPAIALADGTLAYLSHVALFRLSGSASLLAFDEPELHLHPALLMRVLGFFESLAEERPVLLATHSDRLLDALEHPERSAVLCELDAHRATRLLRPDADKLKLWLEKFTMGEMRSGGHESALFVAEGAS